VNVLIVDDEPHIRAMLAMCLAGKALVAEAGSVGEALARLAEREFEIAFVDLRLAGGDGLEVLAAAPAGTRVVIMTAFGTVETAVAAMRAGAADYLQKPFTPVQVTHLVERLERDRRVRGELDDLRAQVTGGELTAVSAPMKTLLKLASRAAASGATVLIRGESGTGKGVLARFIHRSSARAEAPLVTVDLAALSSALLESELFGHVRGAFTGAAQSKLGRIETAAGGTLLLDELGELPLALQPKLLRLVQEQEFERVGESLTRRADVRLIAATNRDLKAMVAAGTFREDLYYRVKVIELEVPPLRARPDDILPLARGFLARSAKKLRREVSGLSEAAQAILARYPWPGNVRELRNSIERAVILADASEGSLLDAELFAAEDEALARAEPADDPGGESLKAAERRHLARVIARHPTMEEAARALGIDVVTLWRRRKKYGLD
jgi:two-component system, NtrC family, response regulator AlgB